MDIETDDLRTLSQIGQALWAEPERSERAAVESLSAVSTLDIPRERIAERAGFALLQRACREGISASAMALQNPFFRLSPEERLVLTALHLGQWTYERVGRVIGKPAEQVARIAWSARLELISSPGVARAAPHPTGSLRRGLECPEYDPSSPWTQAFLDEEISSRDRMFLQGHLLACGACKYALSSSRSVYYAALGMIPKATQEEKRVRVFGQAIRKSRALHDPMEQSFVESLVIFASRREVRWALAAAAVFLVWLARSRGQ